jgi:hypothetical protein
MARLPGVGAGELPRWVVDRARQLAAQAPPLTGEQRDRLAALLPQGTSTSGDREPRRIHSRERVHVVSRSVSPSVVQRA